MREESALYMALDRRAQLGAADVAVMIGVNLVEMS